MKRLNQRGMITVDFIFALVLVLGFSALLFSLSITLTVAEVTQYITFASARNYMAAHVNPDLQRQTAQQKYMNLLGQPVLNKFFVNGWFQVSAEPDVGDISRIIEGYNRGNTDPNKFWGVGTQFTALMLDFSIPFYGSTTNDGRGGTGFRTYLGSYLGREVTSSECLAFMSQRWRAIRALPVSSGLVGYSSNTGENGYFNYEDNGC